MRIQEHPKREFECSCHMCNKVIKDGYLVYTALAGYHWSKTLFMCQACCEEAARKLKGLNSVPRPVNKLSTNLYEDMINARKECKKKTCGECGWFQEGSCFWKKRLNWNAPASWKTENIEIYSKTLALTEIFGKEIK